MQNNKNIGERTIRINKDERISSCKCSVLQKKQEHY